MPDILGSANLYLAAVEQEAFSGTPVYLNGEYVSFISATNCFLNAEEEPGPGEDPSNSVRETIDAFIDGDFFPGAPSDVSSTLVYIDGRGIDVSQLLYINTSGALPSSQLCYINAEVDETIKTAIRFVSGSQQYVQINDSTNYDYLAQWTLNIWVKPRTDSTLQRQGIFVKEGVIETWVHTSGNSFGLRANIGGIWYQALTLSFTKDRWYMLTLKHDGSGIRFYMNGVEFLNTNASGELTSNNNPIYLGRYPTYGTYSDIDMEDVQLWNYALDNSAIAAMYVPQSRRGCQHAYICVNDSSTATVTNMAYVSSPAGTTNPFVLRASQPAGFAEQAVLSDVSAYLVAGGETVVDFDTRIIIDPNTYISWDNIIMVRGNQTRINEIQLADVVYPITRAAQRQVRIPTSYDPLTILSDIDCMINTHSLYDAPVQNAYVVGINTNAVTVMAYVGSTFASLSDSTMCFVSNSEISDSTNAFISGYNVFQYAWSTRGYVHGQVDVVTDSMPMYMRGGNTGSSSVGVYITAPNILGLQRYAFIMSTVDVIGSSRTAYMNGNVGISRETDAYMFGHLSGTIAKNAYIPSIPFITSTKPCFIQAQNPMRVSKGAYTTGYDVMSSGHLLYLKADVNIVDNQPSYMAGIGSQIRATWAYLIGPNATPLTDSNMCFVVCTEPMSSKFAFIVSNPQSSHLCYIVSTGDATVIKSAYVAGE